MTESDYELDEMQRQAVAARRLLEMDIIEDSKKNTHTDTLILSEANVASEPEVCQPSGPASTPIPLMHYAVNIPSGYGLQEIYTALDRSAILYDPSLPGDVIHNLIFNPELFGLSPCDGVLKYRKLLADATIASPSPVQIYTDPDYVPASVQTEVPSVRMTSHPVYPNSALADRRKNTVTITVKRK